MGDVAKAAAKKQAEEAAKKKVAEEAAEAAAKKKAEEEVDAARKAKAEEAARKAAEEAADTAAKLDRNACVLIDMGLADSPEKACALLSSHGNDVSSVVAFL